MQQDKPAGEWVKSQVGAFSILTEPVSPIMRKSASVGAELADGCGLSVSRGLLQLHIIPIKNNPLGSGIPASETASQNGLGTH